MNPIRVILAGATGKLGREVCRALARDPAFRLAGATARLQVGRDVGEAVGLEGGRLGVPLAPTLEEALGLAGGADVLVDITTAHAARETVPAAIERGIAPVVATTGFSREELERWAAACRARGIGGAFIANFALGAMLMMRFAREARRFFPHVEIIEMHAHTKLDAPSGTAVKTKALLEAAAGDLKSPEVKVHSVRLPGLIAHQEVIFGGAGQVLTVRHDATSRECYVPGILITCRWVLEKKEVAFDLDTVAEA